MTSCFIFTRANTSSSCMAVFPAPFRATCHHPQPPPQPHCAPPHLRHLLSLSPSVPVLQWTLWSRITTHQPHLHTYVPAVLFLKLTISHFAPCLATSYFPPWVACWSVCYWHTIFASGLRWVCEPRKVSLHPRAVFWEDEGQGYFWLYCRPPPWSPSFPCHDVLFDHSE